MQPKPLPGRSPLAGPSYQPPSAPPVPAAANANRAANLPAGVDARLQATSQYLRTPVIRYSSRMRVGKLHPMRVSLVSGDGNTPEANVIQSLSGGFDPPIVVQVTAPGALVTPPHLVIPISAGEANFNVQPLISGPIKGAKIEFLSQGRKVAEVPLTMRANKGGWAKFFLWLGLLLPFIINFFPDLVFTEQRGSRASSYEPENFDLGPIRIRPSMGQGGAAGGGNSKPQSKTPDKSKAPDKAAPSKNDQPKADAPKKDDAGKDNVEKKTPEAPSKAPVNKNHVPAKKAILLPDINQWRLAHTLITLQSPGDDKPAQKPVEKTLNKDAPKQDTPSKTAEPSDQPKTQFGLSESATIRSLSRPADARPPGGTGAGNQPTTTKTADPIAAATITYQNEDAIWAWARSKVQANGYQTRVMPRLGSDMNSLLGFDRKFEITEDSKSDWSLKKIGAITLYYIEPGLRFLYRIFIDLPRNWPFADLLYGLIFLGLGIFLWIYTGPNRTKVKGKVMDIRLAGTT